MKYVFLPEMLTLMLMALCLWLFYIYPWDIQVQDAIYHSHWFDSQGGAWPIQKSEVLPRLLFYEAPKVFLFLLGGGVLTALALSFHTRLHATLAPHRRKLLFLAICMALIPAVAGLGKQLTHVHCPRDITRYGGKINYAGVLDGAPAVEKNMRKGACFPAGHASGGFSLMALGFVFTDRRAKRAGWMLGFTYGWITGIYQMLVGAHFLSHTVFMMLLAWLLILLIRRVVEMTNITNNKLTLVKGI